MTYPSSKELSNANVQFDLRRLGIPNAPKTAIYTHRISGALLVLDPAGRKNFAGRRFVVIAGHPQSDDGTLNRFRPKDVVETHVGDILTVTATRDVPTDDHAGLFIDSWGEPAFRVMKGEMYDLNGHTGPALNYHDSDYAPAKPGVPITVTLHIAD